MITKKKYLLSKDFDDVFSYKLICFAYDMLKAKLIPQLIESLKLFYNLPLFEGRNHSKKYY